MEQKTERLIKMLRSGTEKNTLSWETTERKSQFRLPLRSGFVTIDRWAGFDEETQEEFDVIEVTFLNQKGDPIDTFRSSAGNPGDYILLASMHDAARRNANKVDEILSDLFNEVQERVQE